MDRNRIRTPSSVSQTVTCSICRFIGKQQLGMLWRHPDPPHPWGILWHRQASRPELLRYSSSFCPPCLPLILPLSLRRWLLSARMSSRTLTLPSERPMPLCPFPQFWSFRHILQVPAASHSPTWWSGEEGTRCGVPRACLSVLVLGLQQITQSSWVSIGSIAPTVRWMRVLVKPVKWTSQVN